MDCARDIAKPDPLKSKKQIWEIQKGTQQIYNFRNDITYGKKAEPLGDPEFLVKNADTYYKKCKHELEVPQVLQAYRPKITPPIDGCNHDKFLSTMSLQIKTKPSRCILELD